MKAKKNIPLFDSRALTASACLLALLSTGVQGATTFTGSVDSTLENAANWSNGLPDNASNPGTIPTGSATSYSTTTALNFNGTWEGTATLTGNNSRIDNGFLTFNDSSSYTTVNTVALGRDGGTGTINVNDSALISADGGFKLGRVGNGEINQSGGTVSTTSTIDLGNSNGGTGLYNLSGGAVLAAAITFFDTGDDFNFTLGSTGILTILNGGADYTSNFQGFITNGDITLNGLSATTGDFLITYNTGVSTSLQLIPEPTSGVLALIGAIGLLRRRRR